MTSDFTTLLVKRAPAENRDGLFAAVAELLVAGGFVASTWEQALKDREGEFPTGLPFPGGVAIPHTSAEHVEKNALVVATPAQPVHFREMGGGQDSPPIPVDLVVFLVIADPKGHVPMLSALIKALQGEEFRQALRSVTTDEELRQALAERLPL